MDWCFQTVMLENTLESPLESKEIKPVSPKGNQSWIFTGRTDAEAEALILWLPDVKSWLIRKDPDAGKEEEKGMTENQMVRWHHRFNEHEFKQALGDGDGQGGLAYCRFMGSQKVGHNWETELNWTDAGWQHTALTYSFPDLEPVSCSISSSNCTQIFQKARKVVWYFHL